MHFKHIKRRSRLKKKTLAIIMVAVIYFLFASPFVLVKDDFAIGTGKAQAFDFKASAGALAKGVGLTKDPSGPPVELPTLIGLILYSALALVGVVFLIFTIIAGLKWMLAGGNEETVAKAKKALLDAALGVLVVLAAYAITYFAVTIIQ
jgi:hypothetical protein